MTAIERALELKDNQVPFPVDTEKINTASHISERPELLRHDEHIVDDRVDTRAQETLKIRPLKDPFSSERGRGHVNQMFRRHFK